MLNTNPNTNLSWGAFLVIQKSWRYSTAKLNGEAFATFSTAGI
jgi:hypothetical protein